MSFEAKGKPGIIRLWRASATVAKAPAYERHLRENVLPQLKRVPGYLGITLLRKDQGNRAELQVLTYWASMDAIRQFAGDDPEIAVVGPEAQSVLLEFNSRVTHFDVVFTSDEGSASLGSGN
jgi:heme-degrading monooxygenase HmoA